MPVAPPSSPPRFAPRFVKWLALSVACALPLAVPTFLEFGGVARSAEAAGIVAWAFVVARCEGRLGAGRSTTWRRSLGAGFAVWAVVQGAFACVAFAEPGIVRILALSIYSLALVPFFLVALLGQVVLQVAMTVAGPMGVPAFEVVEFGAILLLTLFCGLPNLLAGVFVTNLIELLRRPVVTVTRPRRSPPPDTAPSPSPPP